MMKNRFYTFLLIPEKTESIHRWLLPVWVVRSLAFLLALGTLLGGMMIFDYWHLTTQVHRNQQLHLENRRLRQQVQIFQNKLATVENTLERLQSFSTRLKVILNLEGEGTPSLPEPLPEAHLNLPLPDPPPSPLPTSSLSHWIREGSLLDLIEIDKEYLTLETRLHQITTQTFETEEQLQDQYELLSDKKSFLEALPTRQPAEGYLTSGFGVRVSPFGDWIKMHEGLDIANRIGTPVHAPAHGEVVFAGSKSGYGFTLILNHGYGIETLYGHLQKFTVKRGDLVKRGDPIAFLGNTGTSTAPHLHYEVHVRGYPVDPRPYLFETLQTQPRD